MNTVYVYRAFERFWHWMQALLIMLLGLTGFEIHGSLSFFGFAQAVRIHSFAALAFIALIVFAIFWHFTTGEWRQYLPTRANLALQASYYLRGIFRNEPHPFRKTALSKLNPLQKIVYTGLKALVIPVMTGSGLLYMFFRYPRRFDVGALAVNGLETIAIIHTIGAFLLAAFFIVHLYLTTTGETATSNLRAMVTGYERLERSTTEPSHTEAAEMKGAQS